MPGWTRGRLKTLIFLALMVVLLVALASLIYFGAGPRQPEGADIVSRGAGAGALLDLAALGTAGSWGTFSRRSSGGEEIPGRHRALAVGLLHDLKYLWGLEAELLGRDDQPRFQPTPKGEDGSRDSRQGSRASR